jgi:hypothetical protein
VRKVRREYVLVEIAFIVSYNFLRHEGVLDCGRHLDHGSGHVPLAVFHLVKIRLERCIHLLQFLLCFRFDFRQIRRILD